MKRLLLILLCLPLLFTTCKKEDDTGNSGNPGNTSASIIGTWDPDVWIMENSWTIENGGIIIHDTSWITVIDPDTSDNYSMSTLVFENNGTLTAIDDSGSTTSGPYVVSGNQLLIFGNDFPQQNADTFNIITLDANKLILSFSYDTSFSSSQGTEIQISSVTFKYSRIEMSEFNVFSRISKPNNTWFIKPRPLMKDIIIK